MRYNCTIVVMKKISIWGVVATLLYLGFAFIIIIDATGCNGMFCDVGIGLATLPLGLLNPEWYHNEVLFWALIAANSAAFYIVFAMLQKWAKR